MDTYKIILSKLLCNKSSFEFYISSFKDDISQNYGEKHFITELGEIVIVDFFKDGIPKVFNEISQYIEEAWEKVQLNKESNRLPSIKQDAWRFFADLSPKGKTWYSEVIYQSDQCLDLDETQLISEIESDVEPINLEYKKWNSLSEKQKNEFSEWFVLNPIGGFYAIINSPFHDDMKHNL